MSWLIITYVYIHVYLYCIRGYMCHMRRRIHMSYEEEDTYVI
jgi:hypothetical protein